MNQLFKLTSRDVTAYIHAEDRQEAYARFFLRVKKGEIELDQLGGLLMSHQYSFRLIPVFSFAHAITARVSTTSDSMFMRSRSARLAGPRGFWLISPPPVFF